MPFWETKKEREERIEREKFDLQIKTDMKVRMLEKEIQKFDKQAQAAYQKAESYRAAGNKDDAIHAYGDYQFAQKMRRTVNKSLRMMQQVTTLVKTGNLTNDIFSLLKDGMEATNFNPAAINDIILGNERLKTAFESMEPMMDTALDSGAEEISAEAWYGSGSETQNVSAPVANSGTQNVSAAASTKSLNDLRAEVDNLKKG